MTSYQNKDWEQGGFVLIIFSKRIFHHDSLNFKIIFYTARSHRHFTPQKGKKMPWYFPWHDSIKKKACRYLLHHYLGSFLQEKLSLDQLSIDIYNGTGSIHNVQVDVQVSRVTLCTLLTSYNYFWLCEMYFHRKDWCFDWFCLLLTEN